MERERELVLSVFPGIGLLDMAFEQAGFCVVRGPDLLWGGDIHTFHPPAGVFDGVIGGPPCQTFSHAAMVGTSAIDLIPEFLRVVQEARPQWIVMENVLNAVGHDAIPADWFPCVLRDWDCGGLTNRRRAFWTWPFAVMQPSRRPGIPEHSVMATTWKRGSSSSQYVQEKGFLPGDLPVAEYARLQGAEEIGRRLDEHRSSKAFAVHCIGNGVPRAMGLYIARAVKRAMETEVSHVS